ncbi:MAG TPA: hypothetical protein VF441_00745 [Acidimicrobiia bacterium]
MAFDPADELVTDTVRFEPCHEFRVDPELHLCRECGWLESDHGAEITPLPVRGTVTLERRAS